MVQSFSRVGFFVLARACALIALVLRDQAGEREGRHIIPVLDLETSSTLRASPSSTSLTLSTTTPLCRTQTRKRCSTRPRKH
eukprot:6203337-Pleurochrysis_carterae.AAC.1